MTTERKAEQREMDALRAALKWEGQGCGIQPTTNEEAELYWAMAKRGLLRGVGLRPSFDGLQEGVECVTYVIGPAGYDALGFPTESETERESEPADTRNLLKWETVQAKVVDVPLAPRTAEELPSSYPTYSVTVNPTHYATDSTAMDHMPQWTWPDGTPREFDGLQCQKQGYCSCSLADCSTTDEWSSPETPSPEVGMRFTEVRYGLKSVDRTCVACGDRFYLFADAMLFSSRPVKWPNEIGWTCSRCKALALLAAAKETK